MAAIEKCAATDEAVDQNETAPWIAWAMRAANELDPLDRESDAFLVKRRKAAEDSSYKVQVMIHYYT